MNKNNIKNNYFIELFSIYSDFAVTDYHYNCLITGLICRVFKKRSLAYSIFFSLKILKFKQIQTTTTDIF